MPAPLDAVGIAAPVALGEPEQDRHAEAGRLLKLAPRIDN
jgi:hypothetical protein